MYEIKLSESDKINILSMFSEYRRIDLSIDCVIEESMGTIYVNNIESPSVYFLKNGPLYFIYGNPEIDDAITMLQQIPMDCQIWGVPENWIPKLKDIYKNKLSSYARYIFSSETLRQDSLQQIIDSSFYNNKIKQITLDVAKELFYDKNHSYHFFAFKSPEDFINRGIGYYYKEDNKYIGIAASALACSRGIEIDMAVFPEHRRKGIGKALASYLIKHCLENNIDPHWNAGSEISYKLAESLNYKFVGKYQAYYFTGA